MVMVITGMCFPEAVRAVREIRPRAFSFENVKGLTRTGLPAISEYIRLQIDLSREITKRSEEDWSDHLTCLERHHTYGSSDLQYRLVARGSMPPTMVFHNVANGYFFVGFRSI